MNLNALRFRAYFAAKELGIPVILRRAPAIARKINRLGSLVLPRAPVWVRVRSGLSQGMWMRLHLPNEARLWRGQHESAVQRAIPAAVRMGDVVYDVGAHAGSIALGLTRALGPAGRVVAFEADPGNVKSLRENVSRNQLMANLQVVHAAVWSEGGGDLAFRRGGASRSHGGVETASQHPVLGSGGIISVPAITLDEFVAKGGPMPRLVKVDVEGGEYEVLTGGKTLFRNHRPLLAVEVHHQDAAEQIRGWLIKYDYEGRWLVPTEQFPCCLFAWPKGYDGVDWMQRSAILLCGDGRT